MNKQTNNFYIFHLVNFNDFHFPGETMLSPTGYRPVLEYNHLEKNKK